MKVKVDYGDDRYRKGFKYSPQTGMFYRNPQPHKHQAKVGPLVTTKRDGYIRYKTLKRDLSAARMAFVFMGSLVPDDMEVDHINGVKTDNRFCNLRLVTFRQNQNNRQIHRDGHLPGTTKTKAGNWESGCTHKGRSYFFGTHKTPTLAHKAYLEGTRKLVKNESL